MQRAHKHAATYTLPTHHNIVHTDAVTGKQVSQADALLRHAVAIVGARDVRGKGHRRAGCNTNVCHGDDW
jgi:hypothetical protein